ncbi:hypothetical protein E1B28_011555 [Marasmius oreades]|uniref:Myb-like domain-containing protein n=1 Tax=Marasmius oreades TaxID=181124 RepID=A0A9P7RVQ6_9AGAR|nr:uncharacterized protein E1B28_011555 [Marasmius oreades]KAG7089923.1 hypothetical protein E1B28_011555 [Marasmius oreades]
MDNPQHYQPLSHALHPPLGSPGLQPSTAYPGSTQLVYRLKPVANDEDDGSDDNDEGAVHEQLDPPDNDSNPPSPQQGAAVRMNPPQPQTASSAQHEPEAKRRPGRPRGSKNRKARGTTHQTTSAKAPQYVQAPTQTTPPQLPEVNASNQQYYEFQWRVLNLCAEFYGAAEELVKATPPLVIAQCYQMGPGSKVDPIHMLNEAKRNCDTLLANPSLLITSPPPPMYPSVPSLYQSPQPIGNSSTAAAPPTVISQPQSFVVSMGAPPQYPVYAPPPAGQFPASYYQYPYGHSYYSVAAQHPPPTTQPNAAPGATTSTAVAGPSGSGSNNTSSGAWSDEEVERLKKLFEESKSNGQSGEAGWDWVVSKWGKGRSRHQILIKATQIGLKESTSSRGVKRRRENESGDAGSPTTAAPAPPPAPPPPISSAPPANSSSPAQSATASTPVASPSIQHAARPPSKPPSVSVTPAPTATASLPWPMPTVAANTPPIIQSTDRRSTSYYRPRPSETPSKPLSGPHHSQHSYPRFFV